MGVTTRGLLVPADPVGPARDVTVETCRETAASSGEFWPDHLAWWQPATHPGRYCRIAKLATGEWAIVPGPGVRIAGGSSGSRGFGFRLTSAAAELLPPPVSSRLAARGEVVRIATPTVWEAAASAVVRQVVHRDQARVLFWRLCERFGTPFLVGGQVRYSIPSPEQLVAASEDEIRALGVGFKARTLRALASWCLDSTEHLGAKQLHDAILGVRGIGSWTAAVTVCDRFNDFAFYPVDDLAVRAAARAVWPEQSWPDNPKSFAVAWRGATAPHTGELTALLMAEANLSERSAID